MVNGPNKINVNNDSDSSGNNMKISVNTQKQRQQAFRSVNMSANTFNSGCGGTNGGSTTIKVNDGNSASAILKANKLKNSSIIFLGDCEMPITKSGVVEHKNSGSDSSAHKAAGDNSKFTQKIQITTNGSEMKQQFAASSQQTR